MRLPERIEGDGIVLRRWTPDDAEAMQRAVAESADHLRPWVRWVDEEPATVEGRRALIAAWEREWRDGGAVLLGIFVDGRVAGGCGLDPGGEPGVLEIGYWLHPAFLGRGLATRAAHLLTEAALALPGTAAVEIRHDRVNAASAAVPRRLGYRLAGQAPNPKAAPADEGVDEVWRVTA